MSQPERGVHPTKETSGSSSSIGWGVIVAIVSVVLLSIGAVVFMCYACRRKRLSRTSRQNKSTNSSFGFSRRIGRSPSSIPDYRRDSTRSTTPLRSSARNAGRCNVVPLVNKHQPGKFTFYWDRNKDNWKLCQDAVPPLANTSCLRNPLSPIDEIDTPISDLHYEVPPQPPFSPYHLTWITPQAPPPSYDDSAVSSPSKCLHSEFTGSIESSDTCSDCQLMLSGKHPPHSPFHPNNNTPTTECDLCSQDIKDLRLSRSDYNNNSQFTSYPSTRCSSEPHLTTSSLDTDHDSLVTSYQDDSQGLSKQASILSKNATPFSSLSRADSEIPSLPSSILYYHQRMTTNSNVKQSGKMPKFSPHAYNMSMASSLCSAETHYEDNTSMLANVGSSNTSGNPAGSLLQMTNNNPHTSASVSLPGRLIQHQQSVNEDELSKLVDELSSIRGNSLEPGSINHGVVTSLAQIDNNIGQSYVNDVFQSGELEAKLFRSWSVTAELDYSSMSSRATPSMNTPANENSFVWDNFPWNKNKALKTNMNITDQNQNIVNDNLDQSVTDNTSYTKESFVKSSKIDNVNLNSVDINKIPFPGRKVTFDVPVLVNKTYWV